MGARPLADEVLLLLVTAVRVECRLAQRDCSSGGII